MYLTRNILLLQNYTIAKNCHIAIELFVSSFRFARNGYHASCLFVIFVITNSCKTYQVRKKTKIVSYKDKMAHLLYCPR